MVNILQKLPGPPAWKERWVLSYIFDYLIVVFFILGFSALDLAEPYHQHFSLNNESLQYPFADPERISPLLAGVVSCLFPLMVIVLWTLFIDGRFKSKKVPENRRRIMPGSWTMSDRLWEMNCGILGLGLSVAGAICITGALKNATGKPRPDIIARCDPDPETKNKEVFGLVTSEICRQTNHHILKDGFRSWPSGHSSTAFAGLGYLSLFLAGKLHIMDNRGEVWKTVFVLIPLLAASLVAVSRIMDARHHPFDVITGAMLGEATAWISYRQYFPPISDPKQKGRAYSHRTWGTDAAERTAVAAAGQSYESASFVEQGGHMGSSESFEGVEGPYSRERSLAQPGMGSDYLPDAGYELTDQRPFRSQFADGGQLPAHKISPGRPGPPQASTPPPQPPPHDAPAHSTNPFDADVVRQQHDRASADMGEGRRSRGPNSPEGGFGGRISPPPVGAARLEDLKQ